MRHTIMILFKKKLFLKKDEEGSLLVTTLVFTFVLITIAGALLSLMVSQSKLVKSRLSQVQAIEIAEAGINYYKWHLDNFPTDYADGSGQTGCNPCGPYQHVYDDPSSGAIGKYDLYIYPPAPGSTMIKIKSIGWTDASPNTKRYVGARYGQPSWAQFAVLANASLRFGAGTTIHGPIHGNNGIRFDGIAYNEITSALSTYNDADGDACTVNSWGVHTCATPADPIPPAVPPDRQDIFIGGRRYPVPNIDFDSISADLSDLQELGESANGLYINKSNKEGYHLQFISPTQLQYRVVKTIDSACNGGASPVGKIAQYQGSWITVNIPNNGIIFVEDNVWIDGTITGKFITVVAAHEPLTTGLADVWINNDILYSAKDGTAGLGIITQNNINVGLFSEDNLEINAALLAQKGRVGRYYYPDSCDVTYYKRNTISLYGTIGTSQRYGFSWTCGGTYCSGYQTRNIDYDPDLIYSPPPSFPTSGEYTFISWEELLPTEIF